MNSNTILLVEDTQQQAKVYSDMLRHGGFNVDWEVNADKARETLFGTKSKIHLMVVDLHIPKNENTGPDTAHGKQLVLDAKNKMGDHFPVIVISDKKSRNVIIDEGLVLSSYLEIVEKPINTSIIKTITRMLN